MQNKQDPYSTHLPALVAAVMNTRGAVLELGCGFYSTPILHELCSAQNRTLMSYDNCPEYLTQFAALATDRHLFSADLAAAMGHLPWWGVVLIDQSPYEARGVAIQELRRYTCVFVAHDTEDSERYGYGVLDTFKYRVNLTHTIPCTSLVSDLVDVRNWSLGRGPVVL